MNKTDVVDLLTEQHNEVKALLQKVSTAANTARQDPFDQLVRMLKAHEKGEEEVVYPAILQDRDSAETSAVDARIAEEKSAEQVLQRLTAMDVSSDEFESAFASFRAAVERHASREEAEIFPVLRERDADERKRLGEALIKAEGLN